MTPFAIDIGGHIRSLTDRRLRLSKSSSARTIWVFCRDTVLVIPVGNANQFRCLGERERVWRFFFWVEKKRLGIPHFCVEGGNEGNWTLLLIELADFSLSTRRRKEGRLSLFFSFISLVFSPTALYPAGLFFFFSFFLSSSSSLSDSLICLTLLVSWTYTEKKEVKYRRASSSYSFVWKWHANSSSFLPFFLSLPSQNFGGRKNLPFKSNARHGIHAQFHSTSPFLFLPLFVLCVKKGRKITSLEQ